MDQQQDQLRERLEKAFREQEPACMSCGWSNAWYELDDDGWEETGDRPGEYHHSCRSKNIDSEPWSHRGYYIYLKDEGVVED